MAYKPQNPTPLGGNNEVSWEYGSNLVIADTTDESLVMLRPKEISRLLSFLIPRVTDEQIDKLLAEGQQSATSNQSRPQIAHLVIKPLKFAPDKDDVLAACGVGIKYKIYAMTWLDGSVTGFCVDYPKHRKRFDSFTEAIVFANDHHRARVEKLIEIFVSIEEVVHV